MKERDGIAKRYSHISDKPDNDFISQLVKYRNEYFLAIPYSKAVKIPLKLCEKQESLVNNANHQFLTVSDPFAILRTCVASFATSGRP